MNKFVCLFSGLLVLSGAVFAQQGNPEATPPAAPWVLAEASGYKLTDHDFDVLLQMLPTVNKQTLTPEQKQ